MTREEDIDFLLRDKIKRIEYEDKEKKKGITSVTLLVKRYKKVGPGESYQAVIDDELVDVTNDSDETITVRDYPNADITLDFRDFESCMSFIRRIDLLKGGQPGVGYRREWKTSTKGKEVDPIIIEYDRKKDREWTVDLLDRAIKTVLIVLNLDRIATDKKHTQKEVMKLVDTKTLQNMGKKTGYVMPYRYFMAFRDGGKEALKKEMARDLSDVLKAIERTKSLSDKGEGPFNISPIRSRLNKIIANLQGMSGDYAIAHSMEVLLKYKNFLSARRETISTEEPKRRKPVL
jgi:hypothetical protein